MKKGDKTMAKTVKRGRGHKIGPCKEWIAERENRIRLHRRRIIEEIKQIRKAGFDLHNTPIEDMLDAGVEISNPLYVTEQVLCRSLGDKLSIVKCRL
jgi:hypothetical protein